LTGLQFFEIEGGDAKPLIARESATCKPVLRSQYCGAFGSSYIDMTRVNLIFEKCKQKRLTRKAKGELPATSQGTFRLKSRHPTSRNAKEVAGAEEPKGEVQDCMCKQFALCLQP